MDAAARLQQGDLDGALSALTTEVRSNPADPRLRVFLFQLLAIRGDWTRAQTQLDTAVSLDVELGMLGRVYSDAIACERERAAIFSGEKSPTIFGEPEAWMAPIVEAVRLQAKGEVRAAVALREQGFEIAPATAGRIDDQPFEWIADADSRFGPMLEIIVNAKYLWVPFGRIQHIEIQPPSDLRDQVWMPAVVTWSHGGQSGAFIPTRYPGSETHADPLVRLARRTLWRDVGEETFEGEGQRLLATDAAEFPLMDIRSVDLETASA